jgi:hypothetical protein
MQNTILLRCNDSYGNVNPISFTLNFYPAPPLFLTEIEPKDGSVLDYCAGSEKEKILLKVTTDRGINSGVANCSWKDSAGRWIKFTDTNSMSHSTEIPAQLGLNSVVIQCTDSASWVTNTSSFTTQNDVNAPRIIRIFGGNQLTIKTDEKAICSYSRRTSSCLYNASDVPLYAESFSSSDGLTHTTSWRPDAWYVKCFDECGNGNIDLNTKQLINKCQVIYPQDMDSL